MTRINLTPPAELCDQHLLAEWRELTRIPNGIMAGKYKVDLSKIPEKYTVRTEDNPGGGKGHMTFFFDKLMFLYKRYKSIQEELTERGMAQANWWPSDSGIMSPNFCFKNIWNDYQPTTEAIKLNRKRLAERMPKKPRYAKEPL